jgi:hypothetical protein
MYIDKILGVYEKCFSFSLLEWLNSFRGIPVCRKTDGTPPQVQQSSDTPSSKSIFILS